MTKRILALALALCMVFSLMPVGAQAKGLKDEAIQLDINTFNTQRVQTNLEMDLIKDGFSADQLLEPGDHYAEEIEPNDDFYNLYLIENDYTVYGTLTANDLDNFAFILDAVSDVTIVALCTTEDLVIALADLDEGEYLYQSVYLEYDESSKLHAVGLSVELDAGNYAVTLVENESREAEYEFYILIEESDVHTHSYTAAVTEPTCTEAGYTTYTCSCGDSYVEDEVPALGHEEISDGNDKAATCTEPGETAGSHCGRCGIVIKEAGTVPALGHEEVTDAAVAATCTETGLTEGSHCERCGTVIKAQEEIPALGQEEVTDAAVAATCTETGLTEGSHCEVCETVIKAQEEIPALGHSYVDGVCENCGEELPAGTMQCGENLYATFDEKTGTLTIFGTGDYFYYTEEDPAPWTELKEKIKKVVIDGAYGAMGFADCTNLESVSLSDSVVWIDAGAFENCVKLTEVVLPENLENLYSAAFRGCTGLTSITIPGTVTAIEDYAFAECTGLKEVILQEGLIEIYYNAFENCTSLESITFPVGTRFIRDLAFAGCTGLKEIYFLGDYTKEISGDAFTGVVANAYYHVKNETWQDVELKNYGGELTWGTFTLEEDAAGKCGDNLTWTYKAATNTLTITGTGAMYDYTSNEPAPWTEQGLYVTKVVVEEGATTIGSWAFGEVFELQEVKLPETVTYIGDCAFAMCESLTTINIPSKVTYIGEMCFHNCAKLTNVTLPKTLTSLEMYVFNDCTSLTSITIPGSVATIEEYTLASCTSLKEVILEEGVPEIGDGMFVSSSALETIVIPASVKEIGFEAFFETSLKEITFLGDAPVFEDGCFAECVATAYYPADNKTWTEEVMQNYGGTITWVPVGEPLPFDRIYGNSRCETAYEVADALKEALGVEKFDAIIIANGDKFADALAGSYLANRKGAPILLYRGSFEQQNVAYITENLASGGTVYILGGFAAVPQSMEDALAGFKVERLEGANRFETNLEILEEAGVTGQEILIATGWEFADSLSASATGLPILMVDSNKDTLTDGQIDFLKAHADNTYTIIGGNVAVSTELEELIEDTIERQVNRISGKAREETSVTVAETYFSDPDCVLIAFSRDFPDGLCGGPLAYAMNVPLLLVNNRTEAAAAAYVKANGITTGYVLGGPVAVSDESGKIVFGME